jgi:hypothetical protein
MRADDFITEYKREITAKNLERKLLSVVATDMSTSVDGIQSYVKDHWPMTDDPEKDKVLNDLLRTLEMADPTKHKMYSEWVARVYAKGGYTVEDILSTVGDRLYRYHELKVRKKLKPEHRDINQIGNKDFPGFISVVNSYDDIVPEKDLVDKGDATEAYQDADVRILIPMDQQAACYYGQGTNWCTSSTRGANYFDQYTRKGPLYIIIPKKPENKDEKYQFSPSSNMFMQENDQDVNLNWFFNIRFKDNKNLQEFFKKAQPELMGKLLVLEDDDQIEIVMNLIRPYIIKYIEEADKNRPPYSMESLAPKNLLAKGIDPDIWARMIKDSHERSGRSANPETLAATKDQFFPGDYVPSLPKAKWKEEEETSITSAWSVLYIKVLQLDDFKEVAMKEANLSVADVKEHAGYKARHSTRAEGAVGFDLSHLPELWAQKIHAQLDNVAPGTASSKKWLELWPQIALVDKLKSLHIRKGNVKLKGGKWTPGSYFLYLGDKRIDQVDPYNLDKGKWAN